VAAVVELSFWAASWGAGQERIADIRHHLAGEEAAGFSLSAGVALIGAFVGLVRSLAVAFTYSFFWCAAAAIYLLLRRDVDQTEFDEVFVEDEIEPYGLPPLKHQEISPPAKDVRAHAGDSG
jgi:hypothetical protein